MNDTRMGGFLSSELKTNKPEQPSDSLPMKELADSALNQNQRRALEGRMFDIHR